MNQPSPSAWPPTAAQIAGILHTVHWELDDLAFDLPAGRVTRERKDAAAAALRRLADVLDQHEVPGPAVDGSPD